MRLGILGPLLVADDSGAQIWVAAPRQRTLLAALLVHANQIVPADQLAEFVWDGAPPGGAAKALRVYVARLRHAVGPGVAPRILTQHPGYLFQAADDEMDVQRFQALCREGAEDTRVQAWQKAADELAQALKLWRAAPLLDVSSQTLRDAFIPSIEQLHLQALEDHAEAELRLGWHNRLVPHLRKLTALYPLRERFHTQLTLALSQCGRQAEALEAYRTARQILVGELGMEPGQELRSVQQRILAGHVAPIAQHSAASSKTARATVKPRQLPASPRCFTGRRAELDTLTGWLEETSLTGGTAAICVIDGMAGTGKTALAVYAAHQFCERFPDGQLFLDLHGHTTGYPPRTAGDALEWFLRSLGMLPAQIPWDTDGRAAVYRERLAGTRTLIVLDNASSEAQIRPLLPGSSGCLVLVTSRKRLKAIDDARVLSLDVPPLADAIDLFRSAADVGPADADDRAVAEIATLCGRLPLALRIATALMRHRLAWTVEDLAGLLRDQGHRVATLTDGDRDLQVVFELSYQGLTVDHRKLFGQLGLIPGPDIDAYATAALIDTDVRTATLLLEDLIDHNLLVQHTAGRYRMHDLIRLYARARSEDDPAETPDRALDRLLDYYLASAQAADRHLSRYTPAYQLRDALPPRHCPVLGTRQEAAEWMRTELDNLYAAIDLAGTGDRPVYVVALSAALHGYLRDHGPWPRVLALHATAAEAARQLGDPAAQATALTALGDTRRLADDLPGAAEALNQALDLIRDDDQLQQASTLTELGAVCYQADDYPGAGQALHRALELYRALGDRRGEANALNDLGLVHWVTGDYSSAAQLHERALALYGAYVHSSGPGTLPRAK